MFTTREALHAHYKSDFHRYNLKRKVAGLAPIPREEFEGRKAAALATKLEKEGYARKQDHIKGGKKKDVAHRNYLRRQDESRPPPVVSQDTRNWGAAAAAAGGGGGGGVVIATSVEGVEQQHEVVEEDDDEEDRNGADDELIEINMCKSLFDSHTSNDVHGALEYMQKKYSFFLPDAEYMSELEGMVQYLHQKVLLGRTCLYCERTFRSASACRQHMVDKSHCKIKYDDQEDMNEFADFYDFSSSYDDDGEAEGDASEAGDEDVEIGDSGVEVLPSGELLITGPDGTRKTLGVRWLRRYYQQNARAIDERASVLAAQRERLLSLYKQAGLATSSELFKEMISTDAESNQNQSRALSFALNRAAPRFAGVELRAARQHFQKEHKQRMKLGMNENWNIKHRVAKLRMRGEGAGVHG